MFMFRNRLLNFHILPSFLLLILMVSAVPMSSYAQAQRGPSDVVRDFYKAMREHRFKDAWSMSVYKPAIENLTADEMEDLRPFFESQAAPIPEQLQIDGEKISGNTAQVFIRLPPSDTSPQLTSKPVDLIKSGGSWIIGTDAEDATVKKAGSHYFIDALVDLNQDNMTDVLKRLIGMEAVFAQANNGIYGELKALVASGLMSDDMFDPKSSGYNLKLTINGKTYVATAEPVHYGRTGKLSFWMDQTGAIKSADNGGKPVGIK
jgi:hypothetical protein